MTLYQELQLNQRIQAVDFETHRIKKKKHVILRFIYLKFY